ncbi:MAG TPA: acyl-CoA thioesterase domain-containing protein [Acidimicrobiia bacterium]
MFVKGVDDFLQLLDLVPGGDGVWAGATPSGTERPGLYGGFIAAQALRAAHLSVGSELHPHSLQALFLRAGRFGEPVEFLVDVTRDGRSFSARRVEARQRGDIIFTMLASFQVTEEGDDYQLAPPRLDPPDAAQPLVSTGQETGTGGDGPFGIVAVPAGGHRDHTLDWSPTRYWAKARHALPDDSGIHACALVAMGDLRTGHPPRLARGSELPVRMTTLDYSVWLHRRFRADEWLLFDLKAAGNGGARGLTYGIVHDEHGGQAASFTMELLLRDQPGEPSPFGAPKKAAP